MCAFVRARACVSVSVHACVLYVYHCHCDCNVLTVNSLDFIKLFIPIKRVKLYSI